MSRLLVELSAAELLDTYLDLARGLYWGERDKGPAGVFRRAILARLEPRACPPPHPEQEEPFPDAAHLMGARS